MSYILSKGKRGENERVHDLTNLHLKDSHTHTHTLSLSWKAGWRSAPSGGVEGPQRLNSISTQHESQWKAPGVLSPLTVLMFNDI